MATYIVGIFAAIIIGAAGAFAYLVLLAVDGAAQQIRTNYERRN